MLYEQLASEVGDAIRRGALRAGDRLPSVRRLADQRGVSVATVVSAYLELENAGLIEVRPKKKGGKTFYGCSRYNDETVKCDFKLWQKPLAEACPDCGAKFLVMGGTKAKPMIACADKECGYKRPVGDPPPAQSAPLGAPAPAASPPG
jgi:DNA-binding transcriptional MocR family regulator